jgi:hypothetical protein
MQHDHHNATKSEEADQIENEIENSLEKLQLKLVEFSWRMKVQFHPEKLLSKRWLWTAILVIYGMWKVAHIFKKIKKRINSVNIKIKR